MLSQRLLYILRMYNNPANSDLSREFELIPQDIDFLEKNGLNVEIIDKRAMTVLCRVSHKKKEEKIL